MSARLSALCRRVLAVAAGLALTAVGTPVPAGAAVPPLERQWHLDALRVGEAHRISTGEGVTVAVIDTGVYAEHPDLAGRVLDGTRLIGRDDKGKVDERNHGTGVAGLIAARGGGRGRALGIAPGARILPVTVATNTFAGSNLPEGIRYAVDHGATVVNISNGGPTTSSALTDAVRYAQSKDVVVVAAAGNAEQGDTGVLYPARLPGVIAVGATGRDGEPWSGGTRGEQIAITAPGVDVSTTAGRWSDLTEGGYVTVDGTSAAAPLVAGAAALIRARYPEASAAEVVNRLVSTARDAGPPGRDDRYGFGGLDLVRALTADVPPVDANPLGAVPAAASEETTAQESGGLDLGPLVPVVIGLLVVAALVVLVVVLLVIRRSNRPTSH
ncbi:type VII secretion-associated serine protease mycosin [Micromonospora sagamiensis]|uniref:Type VII secretion-associated serine protease mycosin n=1 Tax=Micromonospora sagamiensis TaxID=47875 RepID=A0A562WM18_9ACTN|nr:type VII secretion-associated serine protease mycosin [Micromonospora sagamiensis]TWJ31256.1 type VII secretion-associated serine protease mycosin [Micromonospora sagamiensis]BCL15699.1 type VII secretion-associated serine protease [Micromonospora sagamiensis]